MMFRSHFLALILVVAWLGIDVCADYYRAGRFLKSRQHYQPTEYAAGIKIQGLIYCKRNDQLIPMKGATARVTCLVKDKNNGYEIAPFSVNTPVTNKKGYFIFNLAMYSSPQYSFNNCKVFLDEAAHGESCDVPTDINNGVSGATPAQPRTLSANYVLYSVGPFVFTPA